MALDLPEWNDEIYFSNSISIILDVRTGVRRPVIYSLKETDVHSNPSRLLITVLRSIHGFGEPNPQDRHKQEGITVASLSLAAVARAPDFSARCTCTWLKEAARLRLNRDKWQSVKAILLSSLISADRVSNISSRPTLIAPTLHHRHCIVHQVPVRVAKLIAIIYTQRDLVYVKRMIAECRKLERKWGAGQRTKSVEGEDLFWHIPQDMMFGGFDFKNKSPKRFCGKAISLALEKLFQTQGQALPSKKSHKWRYKFTPRGRPNKSA